MIQSVIQQPSTPSPPAEFILTLSSAAEDIMPWGLAPAMRDIQLREFWPTEPILASSIFSTVARYSSFGYTLTGTPELVEVANKILEVGSENGKGYHILLTKTLIDLFTQDNGAFIEVVRTRDNPSAPVVELNHLDANRCIRTGINDAPVLYRDVNGKVHKMKYYQVITIEEMPSPIETMYNMQYSCVSRLLRAAQIMKDISIYKREKISGRFIRAVHLVSGIQTPLISDAIEKNRINADAQGLIRYIQPIIIGSLDPTAKVSVATIELASLPDGFNEETAMRWYINQLALAFGGDYMDFAPLPGSGLGSSEQSRALSTKSRGKGPRLFTRTIEYIMNNLGILPPGVAFKYGVQDVSESIEEARLGRLRAEEREIRINSGEITPDVARQIAVDCGDLDESYLPMMDSQDITAEVTSEN